MKLKDAMLVYAPILEESYKSYVIPTFNHIVKDLGTNLEGVYNSSRWARIYQGIRENVVILRDPVDPWNTKKETHAISAERLQKNAKTYGERISLEWYSKLQRKLGQIEDVDVSEPNSSGFVTVTGKKGQHRISVLQQPILNVSSRGLLFHQFPARIYVDGKSISEADYKKKFP